MNQSQERKKILIVFPKNLFLNFTDFAKNSAIITKQPGGGAPLSIATVAGMTPKEFNVKIIDENIEDINWNDRYDIVGITGFTTAQLMRSRQIAEEAKKH